MHDHDYFGTHMSASLSDHDYVVKAVNLPETPVKTCNESDKNPKKRPRDNVEDENECAKRPRITLTSAIKDILAVQQKLSINAILEQLQSKHPESFR